MKRNRLVNSTRKVVTARLLLFFLTGGAYGCAPGTEAARPPEGVASESATSKKASSAETAFVRPSPCVPLPPNASFPPKSDGAVYRALVRLTVGVDGKAKDVCLVRVEGDRKWEAKAFGDMGEWTFPVKYAGQQRERLVSYRLTPP